MGALTVVLTAALVAAAHAASFSISVTASEHGAAARVTSDPCQYNTCRAGEQCVVHEVRCTLPPCPRIGECRVVDCGLSCGAGAECRRQPGQQPRCVPTRDACDGRCLADEQCVETLQPCSTPPCPHQQHCIGSSQVTARRLPPACPREAICPAGLQCVMTKVCRQPGDCAFQMSCVQKPRQPDCTTHWCRPGEQCRMQEVQCTAPPCGVRPVCATAEPPRCQPACSSAEECTLTTAPCLVEPCPVVTRCTPRLPALSSRFGSPFASRGGRPGACPVNDLKDLASKAFCDNARLDRCMADRDCEGERRCCERGCGNTCLPSCAGGCGAGEQCRLVQVQCLGAPCPKVAQCVSAVQKEQGEDSQDRPQQSPRPVSPPQFQPAQSVAQQRPVQRPAQEAQQRPAQRPARPDRRPVPPQTTTTTPRPRPTTTALPPGAIDFGPFGPGGEPIGPGLLPEDTSAAGQRCGDTVCRAGERCRDTPCDKPPFCPRTCRPALPNKPGECPANEQPPSVICFQDRFVDLCFDDVDCPGSSRCCLNGCARQCRPVCTGCSPEKQCRILPGATWPVCVGLLRPV